MEFNLSPEAQKFIQDCVEAGQYASPSAVVEAGIELMMAFPVEIDEETWAEVDEGMMMCSRSASALDDTVEYDIPTTQQSRYMELLYLVRLNHEHVIVVL